MKDSVQSIVIDFSTGNTISQNNLINNKLRADLCDGNKLAENYWVGTTAPDDKKLDSAPAQKQNEITKNQIQNLERTNYSPPSLNTISIKNHTVWENQEIDLKGTIIIDRNASLTLKNVTLNYKPDPYAASHTSIMSHGGSLYIYNSRLNGQEYGKDFNISLSNGQNFVMKDSTLIYMSSWEGGGAVSLREMNNVDIQNNTFTGCYQSAQIEKAQNVIFSNNTIQQAYLGLSLKPLPGSSIKIEKNKVVQAFYHGLRLWGGGTPTNDSVISGNVVSNSRGLGIWDDISQMGIKVENSQVENLIGPAVLKNSGKSIDSRTFRPISTSPAQVKQGDNIKVSFIVTTVRDKMVNNQTISKSYLELTLNDRQLSLKPVYLKAGEISLVEFDVAAPEDGVYSLAFGNEVFLNEEEIKTMLAEEESAARASNTADKKLLDETSSNLTFLVIIAIAVLALGLFGMKYKRRNR